MDVSSLINESSIAVNLKVASIDTLQGIILKLPGVLNFTMQQQAQSQWCWAATATSTSLFYSATSAWTQCTVVNSTLGQTICCNTPWFGNCNKPWYIDRALSTTGNLNYMVSSQITMAQVKAEIDAGHPLGARIGWSGGGGHAVVIYGYMTVLNTIWLCIGDPYYGPTFAPFSTFQNSYMGSGKWTDTYYTEA